ncbi:MerR family transcriptional regulator [Williamsia sp. MIQD14]|uniref:MerR family transcriptional regulator n=1 Tax=Williamsia sp. MIQD14 TaxID=3425703 RepID=UPI003DA06E3D
MSETHLQIGEVADRTGLSIKTIRHYDEVGLVAPSARSAGGFRLYTDADVDRLFAIRRMKPLGFTLDEMGELLRSLAVLDDPASAENERASARDHLADCHTRATQACETLSTQLDYARELTDQLSAFAPGPEVR